MGQCRLSTLGRRLPPGRFRPIAVILVTTHSANMIGGTMAVLAFLATFTPGASDDACPSVASRIEADRLYVDRSLLIMKAAANGDVNVLNRLVASDAHLEVWRGDYTSAARSKGPPGVIELVRDVNPTGYLTASSEIGPTRVQFSRCTWEVTLLLRTKEPEQAISVKFRYHYGRLSSAVGEAVTLIEGDVH